MYVTYCLEVLFALLWDRMFALTFQSSREAHSKFWYWTNLPIAQEQFIWQTISDLDTDHWSRLPIAHLLSPSIFILVCFVMSLLALIEIEYVRFLAFGVHGFPRSDCKDFPALTLAARKAEHIDFLHRDTASILGIILIMCFKHSLGILHNLRDPPSTFITNLTTSIFFEQVLLSAVELNIRRVQLRRNELKTAAH